MPEVKLSEYETERHKPMPSLNHSIVQLNLGAELRHRYKNKYRIASELSLGLSGWPSVPDICIYPKMPLDLRQDKTTMAEPPLCAIEITSPSQAISELVGRAGKYFEHGVRSCWIILLPLDNIYVFSSPDDYEIFRASDTLEDTALDISLPLQEVFS